MITLNFEKQVGKVKPMNAVNNGPIGKGSVRGMTNFELFKDANIPYIRTHDSSFCGSYGGEFVIDVHRVFPNFDADENDINNYIFDSTDKYVDNMQATGGETFYRLGASIEHYYKRGTYPPKDYLKWAKICEHIIMHYTQGWGNGFKHKITYWEIWNEPDCRDPGLTKPCWQGSDEDFVEFITVTSKYLKEKFPHLKIGGPAFAYFTNDKGDVDIYSIKIIEGMKKNNVKLDFVSYHCYQHSVDYFVQYSNNCIKQFNKYGYEKAEKILNEWNYVECWIGEGYIKTLKDIAGNVGAAYVAGVMCACQYTDLDMLMYYDARPFTNWNGLFNFFLEPRPAYYSIKTFGELLKLGTAYEVTNEPKVYCCAASNGKEKEALISIFDDTKKWDEKPLKIEIKGDVKKVLVYSLTKDNGFVLLDKFSTNILEVKAHNYDVFKIEIK